MTKLMDTWIRTVDKGEMFIGAFSEIKLSAQRDKSNGYQITGLLPKLFPFRRTEKVIVIENIDGERQAKSKFAEYQRLHRSVVREEEVNEK